MQLFSNEYDRPQLRAFVQLSRYERLLDPKQIQSGVPVDVYSVRRSDRRSLNSDLKRYSHGNLK
jgi:hypothetical protein